MLVSFGSHTSSFPPAFITQRVYFYWFEGHVGKTTKNINVLVVGWRDCRVHTSCLRHWSKLLPNTRIVIKFLDRIKFSFALRSYSAIYSCPSATKDVNAIWHRHSCKWLPPLLHLTNVLPFILTKIKALTWLGATKSIQFSIVAHNSTEILPGMHHRWHFSNFIIFDFLKSVKEWLAVWATKNINWIFPADSSKTISIDLKATLLKNIPIDIISKSVIFLPTTHNIHQILHQNSLKMSSINIHWYHLTRIPYKIKYFQLIVVSTNVAHPNLIILKCHIVILNWECDVLPKDIVNTQVAWRASGVFEVDLW